MATDISWFNSAWRFNSRGPFTNKIKFNFNMDK